LRTFKTFAFAAGIVAAAFLGSSGGSQAANDGVVHAESSGRGFILPYVSPSRGRKLFASKGCVVCHSINGLGGEDAPSLVGEDMPVVMNPFDFAAKMWGGAANMIMMQEDELGEQIEFTGTELADIISFVHSSEEQKKFTEADIPDNIAKLMGHLPVETEEHEVEEHVPD